MLDVHRYHVKEITIYLLLSVFVLCGCFDQTVVPDKGDFTFKVPKGYIISDITDSNCSIYDAEKSKMVGGIEITKLKLNDLKDENSSNIFRYLRQRFYGSKRMEQVTSLWGDKHPIVDIHLCVQDDENSRHEYYHIFFEKDSGVYHLWLDGGLVDQISETEFIGITGVD